MWAIPILVFIGSLATMAIIAVPLAVAEYMYHPEERRRIDLHNVYNLYD